MRLPRRPFACVAWCAAAGAVCLLLAAPEAGTQGTAERRSQLLRRQRDAAAATTRAARTGAPAADVRTALRDAVEHLEALGAEAAAAGASKRTPEEDLGPELRRELRAAAGDLATLLSQPDPIRLDGTRVLALLERVRVRLEGEVALGMSLQGSYSQTTPREPAYGGHASAMGPSPAPSTGGEPAAASSVWFDERARVPVKSYGGGPTKDHILESTGSGVALLDYDGDGRLDLYIVTAAELTPERQRIPHRNALYRNMGGWKFEDVSARAGVDAAAWGSGACVGDFDGDAHLDLYVTNWGENLLYRNRGDGRFEEVAARAGVAAGGWSTGCAFLDADADGDLDLYVARYVETSWDALVRAERTLVWRSGPRIMVGPAGLPGESDLFFENLGNGRFREAAREHGLSDDARAYGFAVVATDYDDDGWVDLFVANDSNPNFLYRNTGQGRFESVGLLAGVAVNGEARAQAGMGADAGDYDGDLRMDFVLTAFAHDRNTLYRNVDGHQFEDASVPAGLASTTFTRMGWGTAFFDADLDGTLDLFFANGHIFSDVDRFPQLGETYRQRNQLLLNDGGRFRDVSDGAGRGLEAARIGRGLAIGDLDNDGDLDVVVSNMDESPTLLENRQTAGHHWIGIRALSPAGNRFAIGARVTIDAGGRKQVREVRSGGSYLSQSDLRAYFGLGGYAGPVSVEIRMPGGQRWRWSGLSGNRLHELELADAQRMQSAGHPR